MQEIVDRLATDDENAQIATTLLLPYLNHAAAMYESGYATRDDIDASMRFGCGFPIGPLALIDGVGAANVVRGLDALHAKTQDQLHEPAAILAKNSENDETFYGSETESDAAVPAEPKHIVRSVGVVGTGTMASGIVEVFAKSGFDVVFIGRSDDKVQTVQDRVVRNLDKSIARGKMDEDTKSGVIERLTSSTEREALGNVDIVVEAIAEELEVKRDLFRSLDRICKPGAILATTTSSLSIDTLSAETKRPEDVVGMHFFNPATVMKLVEVVSGEQTSKSVADSVNALCLQIGKHPVSCTDRAGFIVNALLFPYLNDAIKLNETGVTTLEQIDDAMKDTKFPMGPFELLDVVGNDVSLAIERTLVDTFGHNGWEPAATLVRLVDEGKLGRKTGAGFHDYSK